MADLPGVVEEDLASFCERWKIRELDLFGSALRNELREDSDIDLLVVFDDEADWSLFDHVRMESELADLLGREVDLITRRSVEQSPNWMRREEILSTSEPIYVAG